MATVSAPQVQRPAAPQISLAAPDQENKTSHMQIVAALISTTVIAALAITLSFLFAPMIPAIIITAIVSLASLSTIESVFFRSSPQENNGCSAANRQCQKL